jgi:hypothetical protein
MIAASPSRPCSTTPGGSRIWIPVEPRSAWTSWESRWRHVTDRRARPTRR